MRKLRNTLLVAGVAAGILVAGAAPGYAQEAGAKAGVTGARASSVWNWYTQNKITHLDIAVEDTRADGHRVYARLVTKTRAGEVVRYAKRWDMHSSEGNGTEYRNLHASDRRGIVAATIEVCVDDAGADTCERAQWQHSDIG